MATTRRAFLGSLAASAVARPTDPRPNIIVIMADDMGFSDIGCYGSEIPTPNIDRLASQGVRFTHFYNCARCCPTRSSLLTGLYNHQAGVGGMVSPSTHPSYQGYLNDRCATFAEVLKPAGYHPLMVGKWHVGEKKPHWPARPRFRTLLRPDQRRLELLPVGPPAARWRSTDEPYTPPAEGFYMTDAFSRQAVDWVNEYSRKPDPYFLYLAYTAPHWPLHALPEDIARHRGKYKKGWDLLRHERHERQLGSGIVNRRWPLTPRDSAIPAWDTIADKDAEDLRMAVYAAQVDRMGPGHRSRAGCRPQIRPGGQHAGAVPVRQRRLPRAEPGQREARRPGTGQFLHQLRPPLGQT